MALTATLLLVGLVGVFLHQSRSLALQEAERELQAWSASLASAVERIFFSADLELAALKDHLLQQEADTPEALRALALRRETHVWLRDAVQRSTGVGGMFIVDAQGRRVATHRSYPSEPLELSDRPYFLELRDTPGAGTVITAPLLNRATAGEVLFVAHRLEDSRGRLLGVVGANVPLPKFTRLFDDAEGTRMSVAVVRRDGQTLLTGEASAAGLSPLLAQWQTRLAQALVGTRTARLQDLADEQGVRHLVSMNALQAYPMAVVASRPVSQVLAAWRTQSQWMAGVAIAALALLWSATALGLRQARLQRSLEISEALQDLNAELRQQATERGQAQRALATLNQDLEARIAQRTAELQAALVEAQEASASKTRFLSHMSHELRTPLNAVLGFAQLLAVREADPDAQHYVELIRSSGEHLLSLIGDLLDLTRIEAGALTLQPRAVAVEPALRQAAATVAEAARRQRLRLRFDLPPDTPALAVRADPVRLQQVLVNLLSNAVKYNAEGGQIHVRVTVPTDSDGHTNHGTDPDTVLMEVRDTGRGMTAAQLARIFEPFDRAGAELSSIEGTGIGLTISRLLVVAMDGAIDVESEPGQGSCFRVRLPRARATDEAADPGDAARPEDAAGPAEPAEPASRIDVARPPLPAGPGVTASAHDPAEGARLRVLYAEDNEVNAMLMQEMCALRADVQLQIAASGAAAIAAVRAEPPDLMLIDMHLGDMLGVELLRQLRDEGRLEATRCVALSADAMPEQIQQALDEGLQGYLTKPVDLPTLFGVFDDTRRTRAATAGCVT